MSILEEFKAHRQQEIEVISKCYASEEKETLTHEELQEQIQKGVKFITTYDFEKIVSEKNEQIQKASNVLERKEISDSFQREIQELSLVSVTTGTNRSYDLFRVNSQ